MANLFLTSVDLGAVWGKNCLDGVEVNESNDRVIALQKCRFGVKGFKIEINFEVGGLVCLDGVEANESNDGVIALQIILNKFWCTKHCTPTVLAFGFEVDFFTNMTHLNGVENCGKHRFCSLQTSHIFGVKIRTTTNVLIP